MQGGRARCGLHADVRRSGGRDGQLGHADGVVRQHHVRPRARHGDRQAAGLRGRAARRCVLPAGAGPAAQWHRRLVRRDRCRRRLRLPRAGARPLPDRVWRSGHGLPAVPVADRRAAGPRARDRRRHSRPGCPDPWRRHVARQPGGRPRRAGQPRRRDARRRHDRPAGPVSRRRSGDRVLHARQLRRGDALQAQHGRGCGRRGGRGGRRSTDRAQGRIDHDRVPEGRGARDQGT